MSKLNEIVKKITQKYNIVEYEITSDQFIFKKKNNLNIESLDVKNDTIILTTTEKTTLDCKIEVSSSEKPINLKIKHCVICGTETTGTLCEKFECYEKFEKL